MGAHLDFHFVDTDLLISGQLAHGQVTVKDVTFNTVLLPPMQYTEPDLIEWLEHFVQNGGRVVHCPANFQEADLLTELHQTIQPSLYIQTDGIENPALWSVQRCQAGRKVWMVLNISSSVQTVSLDARLPLVEIPLASDAGSRLEAKNGCFSRTFAPFEACLLESAPAAAQSLELPKLAIAIPEKLKFFSRSRNLVRLYDWQMSLLDEAGSLLQSAEVQAVPLARPARTRWVSFCTAGQSCFWHTPTSIMARTSRALRNILHFGFLGTGRTGHGTGFNRWRLGFDD